MKEIINKAIKATNQAGVSPRSGTPPPKERQFGQPNGNPRNPGGWKKTDTARYKLEQMLKLSEAELLALENDKDAPYFERKLAGCINKGDWATLAGMMNQVYGMPKQEVQQTNIELKPILGKPKKEDKDEKEK